MQIYTQAHIHRPMKHQKGGTDTNIRIPQRTQRDTVTVAAVGKGIMSSGMAIEKLMA